jgi:fucose permease
MNLANVGLVAVGGLLGLAHGFFYPSLNALAIEGASEHDRGKVMALFQAWFTAGGAVGTFVLGALAHAEGYPLVFLTVGLATFLALGFLIVSPEGRSAFRA